MAPWSPPSHPTALFFNRISPCWNPAPILEHSLFLFSCHYISLSLFLSTFARFQLQWWRFHLLQVSVLVSFDNNWKLCHLCAMQYTKSADRCSIFENFPKNLSWTHWFKTIFIITVSQVFSVRRLQCWSAVEPRPTWAHQLFSKIIVLDPKLLHVDRSLLIMHCIKSTLQHQTGRRVWTCLQPNHSALTRHPLQLFFLYIYSFKLTDVSQHIWIHLHRLSILFCAFFLQTNWTLPYFLPSYWPPHPTFHPSFFHLNLSQGDLGRAHLLSSLSTSIPSETSEAPFLSQNSPISSLLALSITQTISFSFPAVFFLDSASAAVFPDFLQSRLWLSHSSSFQSSFHLTSSSHVASLLHSLSITLPASCYPHWNGPLSVLQSNK